MAIPGCTAPRDYEAITVRQLAGHTFDHLLVGGGLQNGLIAWLLLQRDPAARVALIEAEDCIGGNHTWSFHATDVPEHVQELVAPLAQHSWHEYQVHFPGIIRHVHLGYRSLHSGHLDRLLRTQFSSAPNARLLLSSNVTEVHSDRVMLATGTELYGRTVIDARGPVLDSTPKVRAGYQKFVGMELSLAAPARTPSPILMDACVPQEDGFRFFYVLPFSPDRVLIEDTRFSEDPTLDHAALETGIFQYAHERGYEVGHVLRRESGVLPMPYVARSAWSRAMPLAVGYGGGFMHPATGYSFPVALRVALHVAECAPESPLGAGWDNLVRRHRTQYRFATFLNRLLFTAYSPEDRYHIFQQFYQQPDAAIGRFYRLELERSDMARMFTGTPPRGFSIKRMVEGALYR